MQNRRRAKIAKSELVAPDNVLFSMYYAKYYSAHFQATEIERNHLQQKVLSISIT